MLGKTSQNARWRVVTGILVAFTLFFSTIATTANTAFAESSATLKALPKKSFVDDGSSQLLQLKFKLDEGTVFQFVRITIDGTEVLMFDSAGNPIGPMDPPFEFVFGHVTMLVSDGYYYAIGKAKGKFVIAMDKLALGIGEHEAMAEVVLGGGEDPLIATDTFMLKSSEPPLPDLVAKFFIAPTTIMKNQKYWTFTIETNEGDGKAKQHHVKVYLSEDSGLDEDDKLLGMRSVPHLAAGDFDLIPIKIKAPKSADSGDHFLFVKVDAKDKIDELSEDNNVLSKAANIMPNSSSGHGEEGHGPDNEDDEEEDD